MIAAGIPRHVGFLRHVAFHAAAPGSARFVKRMGQRVDHLGLPQAGGVALQAEGAAIHRRLAAFGRRRVRVMAVDAREPLVTHPREQQRGEVVVFVDLLSVRMIESGLARQREVVVVVEVVADLKRFVEFLAAAVAGGAGIHPLLRRELLFGVHQAFIRRPLAAGRAVALRAAHAFLEPARPIPVAFLLIVFPILAEMAVGALAVPVHPPLGPVAPLVRSALIGAEHAEPFLFHRIPRRVGHLIATAAKVQHILDQRPVADRHLRR